MTSHELHGLLTDRTAINLLKMAYDEERKDKETPSYTIKLDDARKKLGLWLQPHQAVKKLAAAEFIASDTVNGTTYMSITNRGKAFIETFDQLVEVFNKGTELPKQRTITVAYDLTTQEKRILLAATKLSKNLEQEFVPFKAVVQELFPNQNPSRKMNATMQQVTKLEQLQFLERKKQGKTALLRVTEKGYGNIKGIYEKGLTI